MQRHYLKVSTLLKEDGMVPQARRNSAGSSGCSAATRSGRDPLRSRMSNGSCVTSVSQCIHGACRCAAVAVDGAPEHRPRQQMYL